MPDVSVQQTFAPKGKILVIDDEETILESLTVLLEDERYEVSTALTGKRGLDMMAVQAFDLVLLDLMLPDISGLDVLKKVRLQDQITPVVMLTAYGSIETAVAATKSGASNFCTKPWNNEKLLLEIASTIERRRLEQENFHLKNTLRERYSFSNIVGKSERIRRVFDLVEQIASSRSTVLIQGDTGTGKELLAKAIHANSQRSECPFISVDASAIQVDYLEVAFFGDVNNTSINSRQPHQGYFTAADSGTIFIDEINTLDANMQAKLLQVIQERECIPVGSSKPVKVDIRIVAATSSDLEKLVQDGVFRKDLYYRLNVIQINLPLLRERVEDIPLLIEYFFDRYCLENERFVDSTKRSTLHFSPSAMKLLLNYSWPGNVRELENVVERATALATEAEVQAELLPESILGFDGVQHMPMPVTIKPAAGASLFEIVEEFERRVILEELEKSEWSQTEAAKRLHMALSTLNQKIQRLHIDVKRHRGLTQ